MKINEFINESTTAGSIATVAAPMTTQKRNNIGKGVYGNEKPGTLLTGKKTNKKYANSVNESKMKQVASDLETMQDGNFKQKYGKSKEKMMALLGTPANMKPKSKAEVNEAQLDEEDKLVDPKKGHKRKTGLHGKDEESRLSQFKGPFKSSGDFVSDSRGNSVCDCDNEDLAKEVAKALNAYVRKDEGVIAAGGVGEGIGEKIKGAIRREKAKDMPLVQTRRDYAMMQAGDAYEKGKPRKGAQYSAWAERDRKKMGHPTTNPAGTYRTKTTDYTMEAVNHEKKIETLNKQVKALQDRLSLAKERRKMKAGYHKSTTSDAESKISAKISKLRADIDTHERALKGLNEAQSMSGALKNSLAKAEPGSKLDKSIKAHNAKIKAGEAGSLKNAPEGYHFDKKGYCRLGDK